MSNVFLACPLHDGRLVSGTGRSLWATASRVHRITTNPETSSLLPTNCNKLLCDALNRRESHGYQWFAMLHGDIEPEPFWLDILIAEAEKHDADMVSAVAPIKDARGFVSIAVANSGDRFGLLFRLTTRQVTHPSFPDTFGMAEVADALARLPEALRIPNVPRERLMLNTGCIVYRLDRWKPGICFANDDEIQHINGEWFPVHRSEDWVFSKRIADAGGKVMGTRLVKLVHWGVHTYRSWDAWGQDRDLA